MKFYGELLIFILLLITNGRVLVVKEKKDDIVILAPVALILAVLQIFAWGLDAYNVYALFLAFLVFFTNFHAMFRYSSRLYVDHYSLLMKFWATITIILSFAGIAIAVYFAPVEKNSTKLGITETTLRYTGNFSNGFESAEGYETSTLTIKEYTTSPGIKDRRTVFILIPDKRGNTANYRPYIQELALCGFTVCSGDFYAPDCKWMHNFLDNKLIRTKALIASSISNNRKFMTQREFYTFNTSLEAKAMINLLSQRYGEDTKFYFISDVMANEAVKDMKRENPELVKGYFCMDSLSAYKTPGYGCVQITNPLEAFILGEKRDTHYENLKEMVLETKRAIIPEL